MGWCPNCKNEFKEDVLVCPDCSCALVSYEDAMDPYVQMLAFEQKDEPLADRFLAYLLYSSIEARREYDEEKQMNVILVRQSGLKNAKKCYQGFYLAESERLMKEQTGTMPEEETVQSSLTCGEEEPLSSGEEQDPTDYQPEEEDSTADELADELMNQAAVSDTVYTTKLEQYKNHQSTAVTFLIFSGLILIFLVLNLFGLITIFQNWISMTLLTIMVVGFTYVGITSIKRAKVCLAESKQEEEFTQLLLSWLDENITQEFITESTDSSLTPEFQYLNLFSACKDKVKQRFGEINEPYLDSILENFLAEHYE